MSRKLLEEEPPKQMLLFALFSLCSQEELDQLEYLFPNDLEEWRKLDRAKLPENPSQSFKQLGF
jgi:hypothetical protein